MKLGRPPLRRSFAVLCTAGLLSVCAAIAFAGERPVALSGTPPIAVEAGATHIETDEHAGIIRIVIGGKERAVFNDVGLHVTGSINYSGTITDVSDLHLKTDIRQLYNELPKIGVLKPVSFRMKDDPAAGTEYGLIAQQVEPIYPALVHTDPAGTKSLDYIGLIAPLIAAVKELHAENQALSRRIDALENRPPQADGVDR